PGAPGPRARRGTALGRGRAAAGGGVTAARADAGGGRPEDHARAGTAGKFALVEGRATPQKAVDATRASATGVVFASGRIAHEMCCSPVWGSPGESTAGELPRVVLLSVDRNAGERLRALCRAGDVVVRATASVETRWRP